VEGDVDPFHLIDHWFRGLTGSSLTPGQPLVLR
jgi:hypothetical protein